MAKPKHKDDPVIENRRARHDYFIDDTLEVGIKLIGSEVKAVRDGKVSLAEGYVIARSEPLGLELHSVNISEYGPAGPHQHAPTRVRTLLAHKRQIAKLARAAEAKGMTIVPLKLYFKSGFAKLLIGLARGKATHDKRHAIAEREHNRDIQRAMSKRR
jgi:SsrA-binding protein